MKNDGKIKEIEQKWLNINNNKNQNNYIKSIIWIICGLGVTLKYTIPSLFFGFIIGIILAIICVSKKSKFLHIIASIYISIIRGTPLLLQLSFAYFILPQILHINTSVFFSGVLVLSLNSAAYIAEIIRGGFNAIDRGQTEAALSLNLSSFQLYKDILLPQVFRNCFPSFINESIMLIKESSLLSILGELDIMKRSTLVSAEYYNYFIPLITAGVAYFIICYSLERVAKYYEKRVLIY